MKVKINCHRLSQAAKDKNCLISEKMCEEIVARIHEYKKKMCLRQEKEELGKEEKGKESDKA